MPNNLLGPSDKYTYIQCFRYYDGLIFQIVVAEIQNIKQGHKIEASSPQVKGLTNRSRAGSDLLFGFGTVQTCLFFK